MGFRGANVSRATRTLRWFLFCSTIVLDFEFWREKLWRACSGNHFEFAEPQNRKNTEQKKGCQNDEYEPGMDVRMTVGLCTYGGDGRNGTCNI